MTQYNEARLFFFFFTFSVWFFILFFIFKWKRAKLAQFSFLVNICAHQPTTHKHTMIQAIYAAAHGLNLQTMSSQTVPHFTVQNLFSTRYSFELLIKSYLSLSYTVKSYRKKLLPKLFRLCEILLDKDAVIYTVLLPCPSVYCR